MQLYEKYTLRKQTLSIDFLIYGIINMKGIIMKNKKMWLIGSGVLLILVAIIGSSYAYWRFVKISDNNNKALSGCFDVSISNEANTFTLENAYPISDEDGKKLKKSAVACVVENQQYYIIKKEIEHYKEYIEKLQKENEELKNKLLDTLEGQKVIEEETPQNIKENSIPIQKVKDKIEEINKKILNALKYDEKISVYRYQKQILQELLKESEEN